jgi:pimeloyl-ACP methyl ester carboxylesterase
MVMVPGLNCTERAFADLLPKLWADGSVMIANHRRGPSVEAVAAAVLADAPHRFALLGYSMGGYIAFEMLRQAPERITALCFLATSARPDTEEKSGERRRLIDMAAAGKFASLPGLSFPGIVHPANREDERLRTIHAGMAMATGVDTYIDQQTAIIARPDSRPLLTTIAVPTAVIVGEADTVTGVDAAEEIAAGIDGATLTRVAGAGHFAPLEAPGAVADAISAWRCG